jgi:hypothetical protein
MIHIRLSISIMLLTVLCFCVKAQNADYSPGYIVKSLNDTLPGYILNNTHLKNTHAIKFKESKSQAHPTVFTPDQLQAYGLEGNKMYVSRKVTVNKVPRHLFLRNVVTGYAALYYAKDRGGKDMYFLQKDGGEIIYMDSRFLPGVFRHYLSDCKEINFNQNPADKAYRYTLTSLTQTIQTYNACIKPDSASELHMRPEKVVMAKGVKIGGSLNDLYYPVAGSSFYSDDFQSRKGVIAGVYLNFMLNKRWSFQPELFFSTKGATLRKVFTTTTLYYEDVSFSLSYLQLAAALRYSLNSKAMRPYILFGPVISHVVDSKVVYREMRTKDDTEVNKTNIIMDRLAYGVFGGLGISIPVSAKNSISLEARYDRSYTNMNYVYNRFTLNAFQITTGISF